MLSPTEPHLRVDLWESPVRYGKRRLGSAPAPPHAALHHVALVAGLQIRRQSVRGVCEACAGGSGAQGGPGRPGGDPQRRFGSVTSRGRMASNPSRAGGGWRTIPSLARTLRSVRPKSVVAEDEPRERIATLHRWSARTLGVFVEWCMRLVLGGAVFGLAADVRARNN